MNWFWYNYLAFDILALRNVNNSCCFLNNLFGALFPDLGLEMQKDATLQILHTIFFKPAKRFRLGRVLKCKVLQ